jgi:hypothetical protein
MKYLRGESLIELMVFITVMGIFLAGSMSSIQTVLRYNTKPAAITAASHLANARMNLILQQRLVSGFANINDPCANNSTLDACTALANYANTNGFVVSSAVSTPVNGACTATVSVTGAGYATNSMRFVQ